MRRRRRRSRRSHARAPRHTYRRRNQLDTGEMVAAGVVGILLIGGFAWYLSSKSASSAAAAPQNALAQGATGAQLGVPAGLTPQQGAAYLSGDYGPPTS